MGRPLPGDRMRIVTDAGDQICAGPCKGLVATLIMDDGSDCPFFVAVDDGPMSWAKFTAFDTTRLEPFDPERVRSVFRLASHCVAAESWNRLDELEAQMRSGKAQDSREPQPRVVQEDLSSQNLALRPGDAARRAADDQEADFLSLTGNYHHDNQISPSKGPRQAFLSQGLPNQGLLRDNNHSTEVTKGETLQDSRNPYTRVVPFEGGHKAEGIAEWMTNQCEIDPEDARRYAAILVDLGCDRPKDLAEMDHEDWPNQIKRIHMKKIMKALSLTARRLSNDSTRFSVISRQRGLDSNPYEQYSLPFSSQSGYPESGAGHGIGLFQDNDDASLGLHDRPVPNDSQSALHYTSRYHNYEPQTRGVGDTFGGTFGRSPMRGTEVTPKTFERIPASLRPTHHRGRYRPASMDARMHMPEQGSLMMMHSNGNSPAPDRRRFAHTSYSPLRRHASMSRKEYVDKLWGGGGNGVGLSSQSGAGGNFYSEMIDPQSGCRSPFAQQISDAMSSPSRLGHSDRQLVELVHAGTQVSERSRRLTMLDWR